jgi:hypothetical protein
MIDHGGGWTSFDHGGGLFDESLFGVSAGH